MTKNDKEIIIKIGALLFLEEKTEMRDFLINFSYLLFHVRKEIPNRNAYQFNYK